MQNNIKKYLHSFITIPFLAMSFSGIELPNMMLATSDEVTETIIATPTEAEQNLAYRAALIDAYFASRDLPLAGSGRAMVIAADTYDIDWRLIPAMAMRESTGGKFACYKYPENAWGWNSCRAGLGGSVDKAVVLIAEHLSGNNARTAHYYKNKDTKAILETYNPPSVVPTYAKEVINIMHRICPTEEVKIPLT